MVYKTFDATTSAEQTTYEDLADLVEYAEMYMCLHLVADQIRTCLLAKLDLWQDVEQQPLFHLALAIRLRCEETFADSLRHLAGRSTHYLHLVEAGLDKGEAAALTYDLRESLGDEAGKVMARIRQFFMTDYVARSNRTRPDLPVGTTFVASSWDIGKTAQEKAEWLAKYAYRDWFDQALAGETHWSHIRKCKYAYSDNSITADFEPMTLRRVLVKIDLAAKATSRRAPLAYDTTERLTIAQLNRSIARIAAPYLGGPRVTIASDRPTQDTYTQRCAARRHNDEGEDTCPNAHGAMGHNHGLDEQFHAAIANDDEGCCDFTCFTILDEQIPCVISRRGSRSAYMNSSSLLRCGSRILQALEKSRTDLLTQPQASYIEISAVRGAVVAKGVGLQAGEVEAEAADITRVLDLTILARLEAEA
ncbi:hypothetical protein LTR86_009945 [Recurvomyces mirabilis]|nr:hypothetical protein LTR86_009945 [Recurvomyces mirabilis]